MLVAANDLWTLVLDGAQIDAMQLARAIEHEVDRRQLDFRTRLLIRDGLDALRRHWGERRLNSWLATRTSGAIEESVRGIASENIGFPSLSRRIVDAVKPQNIFQFMRELSLHVDHPTRLILGGAVALILSGNLSRHTEDMDAVDEVPAEIRNQHELLDQLAGRYGLHLTHFQSHYLPAGWESRTRHLETFGHLEVRLVDVFDIFVGKLFSRRPKDRDDLRALAGQLDQMTLTERLRTSTAAFRKDPHLLHAARDNWYILFGKELPDC
jgi:hypothetical protein